MCDSAVGRDKFRQHTKTFKFASYYVNVNVIYVLKQKSSEEGVGLCEEMGLQPISELFTTDRGCFAYSALEVLRLCTTNI